MKQGDLAGRIETVTITKVLPNNEGFGTFGKVHTAYVKNAAPYFKVPVLARVGTFDVQRGAPNAYFLTGKQKYGELSLKHGEYVLCGNWDEREGLAKTLDAIRTHYDPGKMKQAIIVLNERKHVFVREGGNTLSHDTISALVKRRAHDEKRRASIVLTADERLRQIVKKKIQENNLTWIHLSKITKQN